MAAEVIVIGGGPAGLAAAIELRRLGLGVRVLERERAAGGIPRHSDHTGFGLRDLGRLMSGPSYARRYAERAVGAGAEIDRETMVTGWGDGLAFAATGPGGRETAEPRAVLLATGCRERPRSARLVPGSRPAGVMTTATLQQLVHLQGRRDVGRRAVVVGAEHVSFSAVATLAEGGASVAAMVTELPRHQSLAAFRVGAAVRYRTTVRTRTAVTAIHGGERVEEVELTELDSGTVSAVRCDLVVFTADWVPDHELAVMAGCELDPGTLGPRVDAGLRTTVDGLYGAGNLLHPAETADISALGGRHVARIVAGDLQGGGSRRPSPLPVLVEAPLRWISPNLVAPGGGAPPRGRFLLRSAAFARRPQLEVQQGESVLWRGRLRRLVPGRSAFIPATWTAAVKPEAGPIRVRVQ